MDASTLAARSGLSAVTLNMIESETVQPRKSSLAAIQQALESGGVAFTGTGGEGLGARFREHNRQSRGYYSGPALN